MSTMSRVPPRVPIGYAEFMVNGVKQRVEVLPDRDWYRYWAVELFERTGGSSAPTNIDIVAETVENPGIEEIRAEFFAFRDGLQQAPVDVQVTKEQDPHSRIESLEAEVARLGRQIEDMKQGTQP